ncbi:MAG: efflux RND transporter periplasmic adaptor subunit, partial [Gammaproteobacteria bacterium]
MNRTLIPTIAVVLVLGFLAGCERGQEASPGQQIQEHLASHAQPGYVCPMHPQVTSDEPGDCPICGMDLVKREAASGAEKQVLYYRHPHDPSITSSGPGKDEMGMDFVPVYAEEKASGVRIGSEVRHNLGVRSTVVVRAPLPRRLSAVGKVTYDDSLVRHIHSRAEGWVERVHVTSVGDRVTTGQPLVQLYSPLLVTAQEEYLQALRMGGETLSGASEKRLRALGIGENDIERLRRDRKVDGYIRFTSDMNGVVVRLDVREGMMVKPDRDMLVLADLGRVWVEADVLARQSEWLRSGLAAEVRLDQRPDQVWKGEVGYVYPEADPVTRAVRVRVTFDNPGEVLKPNSFATVSIVEAQPQPVLQIPRSALIRTSQQVRVIIEEDGNRFVPRAIQVAYEAGNVAVVASGIDEGERVVTSGQFLL